MSSIFPGSRSRWPRGLLERWQPYSRRRSVPSARRSACGHFSPWRTKRHPRERTKSSSPTSSSGELYKLDLLAVAPPSPNPHPASSIMSTSPPRPPPRRQTRSCDRRSAADHGSERISRRSRRAAKSPYPMTRQPGGPRVPSWGLSDAGPQSARGYPRPSRAPDRPVERNLHRRNVAGGDFDRQPLVGAVAEALHDAACLRAVFRDVGIVAGKVLSISRGIPHTPSGGGCIAPPTSPCPKVMMSIKA